MPVNIITPVYNAENSIIDTYESIKNQTHYDWQWILVDDNSTDNSYEICSQIAASDARIMLLKNGGLKGAGGARNYGLRYVSSTIITFIDADDVWDKSFLSEMLPYVQDTSSMAFSGYYRRKGQVCKPFIPKKRLAFSDLFRGSDISCLTSIYHFRTIDEIPDFGEIRARNDLVFNLRALQIIPFAEPVGKALATYNLNMGSISRNKFKLIYWQYFVSRMFGRSKIKSVIDVICWAIYGIRKYFNVR